MLKTLAITGKLRRRNPMAEAPRLRNRKPEKKPRKKWGGSLSAKAQPDEVDRPAYADQEADEGEVALVEPVVEAVANSSPKKQARKEVSKD